MYNQGFAANAAQLLQMSIKAYVLESPLNSLKQIDGSPIFEEPLVGFADGDDPLFQEYKTIIGEFHLTPREILERYLRDKDGAEVRPPGNISVISFVLPLAKTARLSNRKMTAGPSLGWNNARWHGETLAEALSEHVVAMLREQGFQAVIPETLQFFEVRDLPDGRCSNWSQRHAAYAAGLGTFSLNDALITPKGIAHWCCSVVTDLKLPPTPRKYANRLANCPFFVDGSCGACIERCPAGAISAQGHDKVKCREELFGAQEAFLSKPGYLGRYAGCGLCLTRVPCETRIPARALKETSRPQDPAAR